LLKELKSLGLDVHLLTREEVENYEKNHISNDIG